MKARGEELEPPAGDHASEPVQDDQGVDLTLIRRSLDMTPIERLKIVEGWARAILRARVVRE